LAVVLCSETFWTHMGSWKWWGEAISPQT